jgi:hypothetical protein
MLRLDRTGRTLTRLETQPLASAQISERYDLQEFIVQSPEAFFAELGEKILLIASEVRPSDDVDDRIDLLGVDAEGNAVIVELKRGNDKFQLFQAISYAAMIASWEPHDFEAEMEEKTSRARLSDFLNNGRDSLNRGQRIILVAEAFDYSVLIGAEWLSERYGVNIRCCQLSLAIDSTGGRSEYLVCTNIFPAPEIAEQAVRRGRQRGRSTGLKWDDWPSLLDSLPNPVVADFFRSELAQQRESALSKEELRYRIDGTRRWNVHARAKAAHAYVWQLGRFEGDLEFWRQLLSRPDDVGSVKGGRALSFALETAADFSYFEKAVKHDLAAVAWLPQQADVDESEKP